MSLPYFCNIDPRRSKAPYAYLSIEDTKKTEGLKAVRQGISPDRLVVGLNWKGNQETERTNLRGRSMKLEDMAILALDLPDAVFVSLQKGEGSEELETCSFRDRFIPNQDIISNIWSFTETSAHVLACDHIVTTDTSMAHLAGGLGQKTHVVLTAHPEWRWRADMSKSSWYEQTWLSRQTSNGDWTAPLLEVIKRIKAHAALSRLANHRTMH
jgi:hypothetical protein